MIIRSYFYKATILHDTNQVPVSGVLTIKRWNHKPTEVYDYIVEVVTKRNSITADRLIIETFNRV